MAAGIRVKRKIRQDDIGLYVEVCGRYARPGIVDAYRNVYQMDAEGIYPGMLVTAYLPDDSSLTRISFNGEVKHWHHWYPFPGADGDLLPKIKPPASKNLTRLNVQDLAGTSLDAAFAHCQIANGILTNDPSEASTPDQDSARQLISYRDGMPFIWGAGIILEDKINIETGKPWVIRTVGVPFRPSRTIAGEPAGIHLMAMLNRDGHVISKASDGKGFAIKSGAIQCKASTLSEAICKAYVIATVGAEARLAPYELPFGYLDAVIEVSKKAARRFI